MPDRSGAGPRGPEERTAASGGRGGGIPIGAALRALPLERPAASAWPAVAAALQARRRRRARAVSLAAAALLLVALALPPLLHRDALPGDGAVVAVARTPVPASDAAGAALPELARLMHESAQLEAVIAATADPGVGSGAALLLQSQLHERLQMVDALLGSAPAEAASQRVLWQERVVLLRRLAGLEGGEQLLAAHGNAADSTLVMTF